MRKFSLGSHNSNVYSTGERAISTWQGPNFKWDGEDYFRIAIIANHIRRQESNVEVVRTYIL